MSEVTKRRMGFCDVHALTDRQKHGRLTDDVLYIKFGAYWHFHGQTGSAWLWAPTRTGSTDKGVLTASRDMENVPTDLFENDDEDAPFVREEGVININMIIERCASRALHENEVVVL